MALLLRQSTASQSVLIGPFVDDTDGVTAETALTIANTDIRLSKNGGNLAAKNSGGGTHDENGWYTITLDATDTNTLGRLQLHVNETGALPVWHEFQVVPANVYDSLVAGSDTLQVETTSIAANAVSASALATDAVTEIQSGLATSSALATVDSNVDAILVDTAEIGAAGAGLTAIPWNVSWDAEVQSEVTDALNAYDPPTKAELDAGFAALNDLSAAQVNAEVDTAIETYGLDHLVSASVTGTDIADNSIIASLVSSSATADWDSFDNTTDSLQALADSGGGGPTAAQIADAVWDEAQSGHTTAGSFGEIATEVAAILVDTGTTLPGTLSTISGYIDTEVAAIKAKTDLLTFTVSGQLDANIQYVNDVQVGGVGTEGDPWSPA